MSRLQTWLCFRLTRSWTHCLIAICASSLTTPCMIEPHKMAPRRKWGSPLWWVIWDVSAQVSLIVLQDLNLVHRWHDTFTDRARQGRQWAVSGSHSAYHLSPIVSLSSDRHVIDVSVVSAYLLLRQLLQISYRSMLACRTSWSSPNLTGLKVIDACPSIDWRLIVSLQQCIYFKLCSYRKSITRNCYIVSLCITFCYIVLHCVIDLHWPSLTFIGLHWPFAAVVT